MTKTTRQQQFKKMELLVKQLHDHCQKHGIQYYLCHEAPEHNVLIAGQCSEELMVNVACDLAIGHPSAVIKARDIVGKINQAKAKKEESKIITLR